MRIDIDIAECSISEEYQCLSSLKGHADNLKFPLFTIGTDSYVVPSHIELGADDDLVCNFHIGRYTSIARDALFIIDQNHDYRRVSQGRISGIDYKRPEFIRRKGHLVIMNDCWIGENSTIFSGVTIGNGAVVAAGSVVTKDVPDYSIVAGNPAKVIGYRFSDEEIDALNKIRWWNWSKEKIQRYCDDINGNVDSFIEKHIENAKQDIRDVKKADIPIGSNDVENKRKRILYIPDFEQDYPTYPHVIDSFTKAYQGTNCELLLYVKEDDFLEDKLNILNSIFEKYHDVECCVYLYVGNLKDERELFCQVDAYVTNRNADVVRHMDIADMYGLEVFSGVDIPVFGPEKIVEYMIKK